MSSNNSQPESAHSSVTLALAEKECHEHMEGLAAVQEEMSTRPLVVKAYTQGDVNAPTADSKTIHFVRHGQGFHNLMADMAEENGVKWTQFSRTKENPYFKPEILDAPLTEKGRQQALLLQSRVEKLNIRPELLLFSPNCRALQTGLLAFESLVGKVPCLAHEMIREENGVHWCDKRRPKKRQEAEFPQIDFSLLESEIDPLFREDARESKMEVAERIYTFMEWLAERPEKDIAVFSHSGWLLTLFNGVVNKACDTKLKAWWQTGEMRSVVLEFVKK